MIDSLPAQFNVDRHSTRVSDAFRPERLASAGVFTSVSQLIAQNVKSIALLMTALGLAACSTTAKKNESMRPVIAKPGAYYQDDGPDNQPPSNFDLIADATPKTEPLHRGANRPYTVFGKTYVPNISSEPFREQGIASWYGRKYHGNMTSIGETYDMYAMTAAHPTLPLPSYVRVTNPANMKSVVVRLNDRGPFLAGRIIDLSYTAAVKLDIARKGSAVVIVERVFAGEMIDSRTAAAKPPAAAAAPPQIAVPDISQDANDLYLQLATFSSIENAEIFRARVARELDWNREPIQVIRKDNLFRVRMGPYKSRDEAEAIAQQVRQTRELFPIIQKP